MAKSALHKFDNLEKLISSVGASGENIAPNINHAELLAELGIVKQLVKNSTFPDIDDAIPSMVWPSITGPAVPVPDLSGPDTVPSVPGGEGVTGPEVGADRCPICKRKY